MSGGASGVGSACGGPEGVTTEQRNLHFHQLLTRGHEQKYQKADGIEAFEHVHAVDWADVNANDFCIVNQLAIRGQNDRRPDLLVYVNGLPLVLFELKNPYEEEPNTLGAFNQVQHYRADRGIMNVHPFVNSICTFFGKLRQGGWFETATPEKLAALKRDLQPVVDLWAKLPD